MSYLQKIWPLILSIAIHATVVVWLYTIYTPPKPVRSSIEPIAVRLIELQPRKTTQAIHPLNTKSVIKPILAEAVVPVVESTPAISEPINTQVVHVDVQPTKIVEEYIPPSFSAEYLHNPSPEYPPGAKRRGEQGRVLLRVTVSETGEATVVLVSQSSGYALLDQSALQAVRAWRFIPAKFNNHPVVAEVTVPVRFTLES